MLPYCDLDVRGSHLEANKVLHCLHIGQRCPGCEHGQKQVPRAQYFGAAGAAIVGSMGQCARVPLCVMGWFNSASATDLATQGTATQQHGELGTMAAGMAGVYVAETYSWSKVTPNANTQIKLTSLSIRQSFTCAKPAKRYFSRLGTTSGAICWERGERP